MRVKYIIVYLLNFIVAFKFPDGASMSHKLKHLRIKHESSRRQKSPDKLDENTLTKMESLGFIYDDEEKKWKRDSSKDKRPINFGLTPEVDQYTMQQWRDNAASEFENETLIFELPKVKVKFNSKLVNESLSEGLKDNEQVQRLGFMFENGKWIRGLPRNTPRIVEIKSKDRKMTIKVIDEFNEKIVNRLDYIISQSLYVTSMSLFDGALRIGLEKTTLLLWIGAQYKFWDLFINNPIILQDAWSDNKLDLNMPEMSAILWGSTVIYLVSSYCKNVIWDETSGSLLGGSLEHAIVDGILSNYTKAPASYMDRKEMGLNHVILSTNLRMFSSFPKVAFVQFYLQNRIYLFLLSINSLDATMIHQDNLVVILETAIAMGFISYIVETLSFIWIRPPKTSYEEIRAIKESILSDDIHIRMLKSNLVAMRKNKHDKIIIKHTEKKIEDTQKEKEIFKNLSNAWLQTFHNTDVETILLQNNSKVFRTPLYLSNFMTGFSAALSYSFSDNIMFPIGLNIIGNFLEEIPPFKMSKTKKTNISLC